MSTFVVVGGGLAAAKAVETLRGDGYDGRLVVFGDEPHLPYERPPLSKDFLLGNTELDQAAVHSREWYAEQAVELRLGTAVRSLDTTRRRVGTEHGDETYDALLLATGASPRRLPMADHSGAPVTYLRTRDDSERIRPYLDEGRRIAVIGGGWIGLEVASAARAAGADVTVVETLELPLLRVLGPEVARAFADLHATRGVDLRTKAEVTAIARDGDRARVSLADGSSVSADLVLVGVGVVPNTDLADAAGLKTDNGVFTDQHLRTSDPNVFAAGDVANAFHPVLGAHLRVEHWDNAIEQGVTAARNMLGDSVPYERLPYFFTDQYDLGMEYVGHVGREGYDRVVLRGDTASGVFTAFWLRDGRVLAGMHANDWDAIDPIRQLVGTSPDVARLADENVPLTDVAHSAPA